MKARRRNIMQFERLGHKTSEKAGKIEDDIDLE